MTSDLDTTGHLSFEQLCELADAPAGAAVNGTWRTHVSACAECAGQLSALGALGTETSRLPREVTPPPELWTAVRAGLTPRDGASRATRWKGTWWRLAAAGLLVAASSSAITVLALRARDRTSPPIASRREPTPIASPSTSRSAGKLPAHLASTEMSYARSVEALRRTLDERRDSLSASTVETVERSLRIADEAIAEAREALERDPANGLLVEIFTSNYERKIDLLRRATELAPRT